MNMRQSEQCMVCLGMHNIRFCAGFKAMTVEQREGVVLAHRYCINCLGKNHFVRNCPWSGSCRMCGSRHNTMLHRSMETTIMGTGNRGANMAGGYIYGARSHPYHHQRASQLQQQQQLLIGLQTQTHTNEQLAKQHQQQAKKLQQEAKQHQEKAKQYRRKAKQQKQQETDPQHQSNQQRVNDEQQPQKANQQQAENRQQEAKQQNANQNQNERNPNKQIANEGSNKNTTNQKTPEDTAEESDRMERLLNVLEKIASALTVAPVQGARHVGILPNPLDDMDVDLIELDKSLSSPILPSLSSKNPHSSS
ncbi:uncharacterized protein [Musca autumnalis]